MRRAAMGFVLLLLAGCATTLEHPVTHQTATCKSGWALGGGTGIAGAVMLGISVVGNMLFISEYQQCIDKLKEAGFQEPQPTASTLAERDP